MRKLYRCIATVRYAIEREMLATERSHGSGHVLCQTLLRTSAHLRRAEMELYARHLPVCAPLKRSHWHDGAA
jgi:hypothetical protein